MSEWTTDRRARDLGVPLEGAAGTYNSITDVVGVEVGYRTLIEDISGQDHGGSVRTGVTAILPRGRHGVGRPCAAGWFSLNGNGEMTGTTWIEERGELCGPILITNTHAVGACHAGAVRWMIDTDPQLAKTWLLPVVAETYDGYLNDINGLHVESTHALQALDAAGGGPVAEGSLGGGTGMICYGFKGGNGTSSRLIEIDSNTYTVGAFAQTNFGKRDELTIRGRQLPSVVSDAIPIPISVDHREGTGSVIVVVATDAPLLPGQCKALARRVPLGLARTGTTGSHTSGDIFLALSTADHATGDHLSSTHRSITYVPWENIDPLYAATVQSVEEAVLNSLTVNQDMQGQLGRRVAALPKKAVAELFAAT